MENRIGRETLHRQLNRRLGEKLHNSLEYLGYAATPDSRMLVSDGTLILDPNADDLRATYVDSRLEYDNGSLDGSLVYKLHDGNVLSLRRKPDGTWAMIFEYCYVETASMEGDAIVTRRFTSTHDKSKNYLWITRTPLDTCETVVVHDRKSHDYRAVESAIDALCDEKRLLTMATS